MTMTMTTTKTTTTTTTMKTHPVTRSFLVATAALLASACAGTPADTATTGPTNKVTEVLDAAAPAGLATPVAAPQPSVPLAARPHTAPMHEVALAPDGASALTLDSGGGVRLWPSVDANAVPWELPMQEPLWMSLAATDNGFIVAFVDTTGTAHVGRVELSAGTAQWVRAFDVPPTDPIFEVHVLGGGDRILALGVDHRVRLWDAQGQTVAELDQRGVVPWQLRVQHDADGKPHAAIVQFAPVRIQRLRIADEGLELQGTAHRLAIDQSPNRNDIAMSPDGRYATAMQKPQAGKSRFELEVVNLHDGSRRMLVGESDTGFRPRIHPLADEVLAETGSGKALRLSLDAAVPWQPGADRTALLPVSAPTVSLAGSNENSLMHTTVRGGVHAVAWDTAIHMQTADGQPGDAIANDTFAPTAVGLSSSGATVAWASPVGIVVEPVSGDGPVRTLAPTAAPTNLVAFVGEAQLVTMDDKGRVQLRDLETDAVLDSKKLPLGWEAHHTGWRPSPEGGHVVLASTQPSAPLQVLAVQPGELGSVVEIERSKRTDWPEGGKPPRAESTVWMASQGHDLSALSLKPSEVLATLPEHHNGRSAVMQHGVLTMIDAAKNERLWAHAAPFLEDAAWSGNGQRFAFADVTGGYVCDPASGSVLLERRTLPSASARTHE